jgi:hypothetical protein
MSRIKKSIVPINPSKQYSKQYSNQYSKYLNTFDHLYNNEPINTNLYDNPSTIAQEIPDELFYNSEDSDSYDGNLYYQSLQASRKNPEIVRKSLDNISKNNNLMAIMPSNSKMVIRKFTMNNNHNNDNDNDNNDNDNDNNSYSTYKNSWCSFFNCYKKF